MAPPLVLHRAVLLSSLLVGIAACGAAAPPSTPEVLAPVRGPSREAHVPSGRLDLGFGTVELSARVRPGPVTAAAVTVDARGRTLALFRADPSPSDSHGVLVALDDHGALDTTFGKSGVALLSDPKAAKTFPYGLALFGERLVAYGNVQVAARYEGAVWPLANDGKLVTSGVKHLFYDANVSGTTEVWALAPSTDRKALYVSGRNGTGGWIDRFAPDGSTDTTWNDGMPRSIAASQGENVRVHALAPADDGTLYALASAASETSAREALFVLDAVGNVAEVSGAGLPGGASPALSDLRGGIVRQRDGKLVIARCDAHGSVLVQRVGPSGALDGTFASQLPPEIAPCRFGDLALLADGSIVVGWFADGSRTATLARLTNAGALDTTFGHHGFVALSSPSGVTSMRFTTTDRHVVIAWTTVKSEAFVARYWN